MAKYLIIGASAAAIGALNRLIQLDPQADIVLVSRESEVPYNKCFLADVASGLKTEAEIYTLANKQLPSNVTSRLSTMVVELQPEQKRVVLENGDTISYEYLLIATGSAVHQLTIPSLSSFNRVLYFHTLADVKALLQNISAIKKAIVIGAGLSGLECADALQAKGVSVVVVERNNQILPGIDPKGARLIQEAAEKRGIRMYTNTTVKQIISTHEVELSNGMRIGSDVLVVAAGSYPQSSLAQEAGIACHENGAIIVNEQMMTSISGIFAAGDVVMVPHQITRDLLRTTTWPEAMLQGNYAAYAMAGSPKAYPGMVPVTSSAFFGLKYGFSGVESTLDGQIIEYQGPCSYERYILDKRGILRGFLQVGPSMNLSAARRSLLTQLPVDLASIRLEKP